ncbi:MAG TPA: type IV pilus modification protein PilV [Candidatus Aquabacterium excrementipullorum]|nr:type IV pilus modification protein PilV [Candidatus Aquabacterium excrementipullorum]
MLLEVLVALLIFAIGVLGLVSMQSTAVRQSSDAQYRTIAAIQAQNLISQMWMSKRTVGVLSANYASGGAGYTAWYNVLKTSGLPQVTDYPPTVTFATGSNLATITVFWKAPGDTDKHQYIALAQVAE